MEMSSGGAMPTPHGRRHGHDRRRRARDHDARRTAGARTRSRTTCSSTRRLHVRGDGRRRRVDVRPRRRHRLVPRRPGVQLADGALPDPASIRVEEWVNAFDYDDPAPTDGAARCRRRDGAPRRTPTTARRLVRVGVGTADLADADRPPANITFVIDTSGSMDIRDRLGLVQVVAGPARRHAARRRHDRHRHLRRRRPPVLAPTEVARRRADHRRHRRARPGRQHEHGGRPAARLRAGPRRVRRRRPQRRRPRLRRRRQRRRHRPDRADRADHQGRRGGHPPRHRRLRDGQLQRPPDGAAGRPGRRLLRLRRHVRGGRAAVRRGPHADADRRRRRRQGPGRVRSRRRRVVPADRLREPDARRRGVPRRHRRRRRARPGPRRDRAVRGAPGRPRPDHAARRRAAGHRSWARSACAGRHPARVRSRS